MTSQTRLKVAILDLNNNHPNQGLRCIREIVDNHPESLDWQIFDVRYKQEIPDTSFDIYIGSGGPDSPLADGPGEKLFLELLDELWKLNKSTQEPKKQFLFICHSFQLACRYFDFAEIKQRKTKAFGITPIHKTESGQNEPILNGLPDPFFALDFRDWQIVKVDPIKLEEIGASIICREKVRSDIQLERAVMGVRFSPDWIGLQFHPEADPVGIASYFKADEKRASVIDVHGKEKYNAILDGLNDSDKIPLTYETVIPKFLEVSLGKFKGNKALT